MKKTAVVLTAALLLPSAPALAFEVRTIKNSFGVPVFELRYFDVDDGPFVADDTSSEQSVWPWTPNLYDLVDHGVRYWAEVIQPIGNQGPAVINIGTDNNTGNAFGMSPQGNGGTSPKSLMQQQLQGLPMNRADLVLGAHGVFGLGPSDFPSGYTFTQLPITGKDDLVSTAIHELAHGLGVTSNAEDQAGKYTPAFGDVLSGWAPLMVDDHGRPARPGQAILCDGCNNADDPEAFDVRQDKGMLVGPNIRDALEGGLPGVPISMLARQGDSVGVDDNNMSHIELRNSMMSHQNYRNYTGFMEAELAVMQDLGFSIDRRNFFGRSIYGNGLDIVNDRGFFARNREGTRYLPGQYNSALLGLGLHIYGDNNRVRQVADLLAAGEGGAGIRVDGEGNTVTIDPGVRVHANGAGGQGVMFAYGRNHQLVQRGDVEALGPQGVALRFDFGDNALMDEVESRGSYIHTIEENRVPLLPELNGPLVSRADITGRVAGREAAILVSKNAYVPRINIMQGATLEGDIVSDYHERDGNGALRLSTLSFGQRANDLGQATGRSDPGFRFAYTGSIRGAGNLALSLDGGITSLNGRHQVHGVSVQPQATLAGTSTYDLTAGTTFSNAGTLAPGNSIGRITINGDFVQTPSGRLQTEFDPSGAQDVLVVNGTAVLAGTLDLTPEPGWYENGWTMQGDAVQASVRQGQFDTLAVAAVSPTLSFAASGDPGQGYRLQASRAADAYSRYGDGDNTRAAGQALQQMAAQASVEVQPFFRSLDFSAPDGTDVGRTLKQVSPSAYSAGMATSLRRERNVVNAASRGFADGVPSSGSDWKGYAVAFGSKGRQHATNSAVAYDDTTYGLVVGGGRRLSALPDVSVGVQLDVAEQSAELRDDLSGKAKASAFGVGVQLRYQPDARAGAYALGGARFGIEDGSMRREVSVSDYRATHRSDWTGHTASLYAGGGYQWRLGSAVSAGPFAALDYTRLSRPGQEETGPLATRLILDAERVDAMRSSLGMSVSVTAPLRNQDELVGHARASWDREWLDRDAAQTAGFAAWPAARYTTRNALLPRDSLGLQAGVSWRRGERVSVGLNAGAQLGSGYKSLTGELQAQVSF